jgi:glycosyltransferase involved in cell wall biosynthesis
MRKAGKKLRVGIDIRDSKNPCGVGRYIRELVMGLQNDDRIQLTLFHDDKCESLPYSFNSNVLSASCRIQRSWLWEQYWLPQQLAQRRIEVYHATNNVGLPWAYSGYKVITIHDIIPILFPDTIPSKKRWFRYVNTLRLDARLADVILTDSCSSRNDIVEKLHIASRKVHVIWPVEFTKIDRKEYHCVLSENERTELGIIGRYIVHNGGMDPRKNLIRLLDAFRIYRERVGTNICQLVLTGRSRTPYACKIVKHANDIGIQQAVVFTDEIEMGLLRRVIRGADCVIYPSLIEGFGLPIIEAMKAGVPVITSHLSAMREIAGGAAYLVNPYETDDIARALVHLHGHPHTRSEMIASAARWVESNATRDMIRETADQYFAATT